ncbi:Synaptonemal complex protein 3 [Liparis tanakae]|uniref:Synaptonemal complex protein 3 n=1 Tax=Liparis tanakae TaxID=230148 RepID=A0A4Z2J187_9TELE|nr:Synaptonemal complex protein 3 [Liparis tanakae]
MSAGRKVIKKKHQEEKMDKKVFDFITEDEKKELSCSDEEVREDETPMVDKSAKKRPAAAFEEGEGPTTAVGNEVHSMLEKFGADISKVMQNKKKRLESLTKNYMKGSQHKLEQLWNSYHGQRQQQKILQQARVVQNQKLKTVRELYEQFVKNMEEMEKSHNSFLQGAQQELRKEMANLQKKILMETQQQEMATVRKSLHTMLF